jgi:hypothetical protein
MAAFDREAFGRDLREVRKRRNDIGVRPVVATTGIGIATLRRVERGTGVKGATIEVYARLASWADMSLDAYVTGEMDDDTDGTEDAP